MSEMTVPFSYPGEATADEVTREGGEALRGLLELVLKGRTKQAQILRLQCLALLLGVGNGAESIKELAARAGCSKRRVEQVFREMHDFVHFRG